MRVCTYEWWYIMFCNNVRIVYMCMHVGVNEYAASVCMYERMIECEYRFHTPFAASRTVNAGKKNVCMYACIQLNMVLVLVPSNWMRMLVKLVVCTSKRAISIAVRLAELLEETSIHTYIHTCIIPTLRWPFILLVIVFNGEMRNNNTWNDTIDEVSSMGIET